MVGPLHLHCSYFREQKTRHQHHQPVAYAAPATTYAAPAVQYAAPATTYAAPAVQYAAPAVTTVAQHQPVTYAAPATTYAAPAVQYAAPAVTTMTRAAPAMTYAAPQVFENPQYNVHSAFTGLHDHHSPAFLLSCVKALANQQHQILLKSIQLFFPFTLIKVYFRFLVAFESGRRRLFPCECYQT